MAEWQNERLFIPYEIPLGDGERARMRLPADLTQEEAERLCRVIQSLALPGETAAPDVPRA